MWLYLFLVVLGAFIATVQKVVSAQKNEDFTWRKFWKKNLAIIILNAVTGVGLILAIYSFNPEVEPVIYKGINIVGVIWLLVGATGHIIWKLLIDVFLVYVSRLFDKFYNAQR
jgi:hypothetical protein